MFLHQLRIAMIFLFIAFTSQAQHKNITFSPEPEWIKTLKPDLQASQPDEESSGYYYLLVDHQDFVETREHYRRYAYKILSTKGVQEMADLTIDFDPEYQQVKLHQINILRNGRIIIKLQPDLFQVVQRESSRERFLYDGSLTFIANLTDVRIGDVIDYSYTITGTNPIYQGKYQKHLYLQTSLPLNHFNYTVTIPKEESLPFKKLNEAGDPIISITPFGKSYTWENRDIKPLLYESNSPSWYDPLPAIQISQFTGWKEVVDNLENYYSLGESKRAALKSEFLLKEKIDKDDPEFVEKAIRFVQDEVRYLGFENGLNSFVPSDPLEVLTRRYGDCKDKSFLLSELLKANGYKANPMLVHSENGKGLNTSLPSAVVFDHCVVQIDLGDNNIYYVDPTISDQGGTVATTIFPNYEYGLVLQKGEQALTKLPVSKNPRTEIIETFIIDDIGGGADLEVKTIYRGYNADMQRQEFAQMSRKEIQQSYTDFYNNLYQGIKAVDNITYEDNRQENTFTVLENYRIDSLWTPGEDNRMLYAEFFPMSIQSFLYPEQVTKRTAPYSVNRNTNISHKTIAFVPVAFNIKNEKKSLGTNEFRYDFDVKYKNAKLEITHEYESYSDFISPENLPAYLAEHEKAQELLSYGLQHQNFFGELGKEPSISWLSLIIMCLVMGGSVLMCSIINRKYDLPSKVNPKREEKIGGWLILLGLGLAITPLSTIAELMTTTEFFTNSIWDVFFTGRTGFLQGLLFVFELIYNSIFIIFSIFVLILFLRRRTIAPKMIIILMGVSFLMLVLDTFATLELFPEAFSEAEKRSFYVELGKVAVKCGIWIPYLIYSQRVENTFTRSRKKPVEETFNEEGSVIALP